MNTFGKRLKELREGRYTQEELAKVLKTSRSRIGMYEQGRREPDFETQTAIADLFHVSIDYLLGRSPEDIPDGITDEETVHALEFYYRYSNASPDIRAAIDLLLKPKQ